MFNKKVRVKTIAYLILIPSILILIGTVIMALVLFAFGIGSGVSIIQMIPFLIVSFFSILVSVAVIYIAIRYFQNKPFKENHSLGLLLIIFSFGYFFFISLEVLLSNLTGNEGGWLRPIVAFFFLLIFVPLGLGMKNGYIKD